MTVTFERLYAEAAYPRPGWRLGQTAFNLLHRVRPDVSEQVRGAGVDPFHDDTKLPAFWAFVRQAW